MKTRKTIPVDQVREWVNTRLVAPDSAQLEGDCTPEQAFRLGLANVLEQILHATGNYRGYYYPDSTVMDETRRV